MRLTEHSQPASTGANVTAKGIADKSHASSAWQGPCARNAQDVGGSLPTHPASDVDGLATEARRQNEAAREQADQLTHA